MTNNICIIDKAVMPTFRYMFTGTLVFTPENIYFIATGKVSNVKIGLMAGVGGAVGGALIARDYQKAFDQSESMESYTQKLDKLVMEKEGSIKINKFEIKSFKQPSGKFSSAFKIKTEDKKYEFNIANAIREKQLPEILNYVSSNLYISR